MPQAVPQITRGVEWPRSEYSPSNLDRAEIAVARQIAAKDKLNSARVSSILDLGGLRG